MQNNFFFFFQFDSGVKCVLILLDSTKFSYDNLDKMLA